MAWLEKSLPLIVLLVLATWPPVALAQTLAGPAAEPGPATPPTEPAASPPTVVMLSLDRFRLLPAPDTVVIGRRPPIEVVFPADLPAGAHDGVAVTVDGMDVTSQVARQPGRIAYRPASDLVPGPHTVMLTFTDPAFGGGEPILWSFKVRDYGPLEEGSLGVEGSLTYEQAVRRLQETDPHWNLSGNLKIGGRIAEQGVVVTLDGNLRYIDAEGPGPPGPGRTPRNNFDLANFLFTVRKDPHQLRLGDIQIAESFLSTGPAFARRGGLLTTELFGTEVHLFSVRSNSIIGFDHGLGIQDSDRRIQGASIARDLLPEKALRVKVTYLDGENAAPQSFNTGSAEGGQRGEVFSMLASSSLFGQRLRSEGEVAFSRFDADIADQFGRKEDIGARVKVDGTAWEMLNLGVEYQRVEPDFQSIANPYFVRDREGVTAMANTPWGPTRYTLGFSWAHDNLRNDPLLPRIEQKTYMASWGLQVPDYPMLMLTYNRSEQESTREPTGFAKFDTVTDGFTGTLSYGRPTWNATLNGGYSLQDNREGTSPPDTSTWNTLLAFGVRPTPNVNVAPSLGFTRSKDRVSDVTRDTYLATLTSNIVIVPEWLTFDSQVSFNRLVAHDDLSRSNMFSGIFRFSLRLERLFGGYGKQTASLRFNYNRFEDEINSANNREQWGAFFIIDLFAPLPLLPPSWADTFGLRTPQLAPNPRTASGLPWGR